MKYYPSIIDYSYSKNKINSILPTMFKILSDNMSKISPSGNTPDKDYTIWSKIMEQELFKTTKRWIFAFKKKKLCGYMLYSIYKDNSTAHMDEIQIKGKFQGDGITFAKLMGYFYMNKDLANIKTISAYANKKNIKSQEILKAMGFTKSKETKQGCYYKAKKSDALSWYIKKYRKVL